MGLPMEVHRQPDLRPWLVCRVGTALCALPIDRVVETMRPLPIESVAGAPAFVRGVSLIRGAATVVVDAAMLLGAGEGQARTNRLVTVRTADRVVALAVDSVVGVRTLPAELMRDLPPLLQSAGGEVISAIAVLDKDLVFVLRGGRLVPNDLPALRRPDVELPS